MGIRVVERVVGEQGADLLGIVRAPGSHITVDPLLDHARERTRMIDCRTVISSAAVIDARHVRRRGQVYVALAAVAWSSAGVLQRELSVDVPTQVAGRALFAALALFAFVAVSEHGSVVRAFTSMGRAGLAVAVCTAIASWLVHRGAQPHDRRERPLHASRIADRGGRDCLARTPGAGLTPHRFRDDRRARRCRPDGRRPGGCARPRLASRW